jgi:hypothetical protein
MGGRLPAWVVDLLDQFGRAGRLFGHGVMYSPTSAIWEPRQAAVRTHTHTPFCLVRACAVVCVCVCGGG